MFIIGGLQPLGGKGSHETTTVSRSASGSVTPFSPIAADEIFLKLSIKLGCLKVSLFFGKKHILRKMLENSPKIVIFGFFKNI